MRKSIYKRIISLLIVFVMILTGFPLTRISSKAASGNVKNDLDVFISSHPDGSRWTSSFDGGSQCYGFAKLVIYNLFGSYNSSRYRSWSYAGVSTSGMNVIGSITSYSASNVQSLLSNAKCGDALQFDETKQHSMIVYSVESDGVWIYDCNWDNNCGVSLRKCTFGTWSGRNSKKLTLLRSDNYPSTPDLPSSSGRQIWLPGGPYVIHSAINDNYVLDISGDSKESNANIQLYGDNGSTVQQYQIVANGDYYSLKSVYSGNWLDVGSPIGNNSNVKLYYTNSLDDEKWVFEDAGDGYVYIRALSGYYLDVQGDKAVNNANVQVYQFVGNNSQKWRLEPVASRNKAAITIPDGTYIIHSALDNNYVFDISGNSTEIRANIQLYQYENSTVQKFKIKKSGNYYVIQSVYNNLWLDIHTPIETKANVQLWESNTSYEQKWVIKDAGDGYVYILSSTGYSIDVENDAAKNNQNIQIYQFNATKSQKWKLECCHSYNSGVITTPATCQAKGVKTYTCTVCGATKTESLPMISHSSGSATCTEDYKCVYCGTVIEKAKGHSEVVDNAIPATCTKTGLSEGKHCSVCKTVIVKQEIIPIISHFDSNSDGKCDSCGTILSIPGDANDDGIISLKDVAIIRRYLAGGWDVTLNTNNTDYNGDGSINLKDVALIRKQLVS